MGMEGYGGMYGYGVIWRYVWVWRDMEVCMGMEGYGGMYGYGGSVTPLTTFYLIKLVWKYMEDHVW